MRRQWLCYDAVTAWETYVEDRIREEVGERLRVVNGSYVGKFVLNRLEDELKRFHSPASDKIRKLFLAIWSST